MRILHTADNHIGREEFAKIDKKTGMNARGLDYLESFKNICKIALNERVDLFLIAGDMFDNPDPNQYYIIESMRMLKKVSKAGITTLIINGNTDLSKKRNPLAYLAEIENVYVTTKPDTFILGSYDIVCVPYSSDNFTQRLDQALSTSPSENKILVSHIPLNNAIQGTEAYENIQPIDVSLIPDRFIYSALGHMHKFQQIEYTSPIFYSGASERFNFSEEGEDKYALLVEVDGTVSVKPYRLPVRPMHSFDIDCLNLKANEILSKIDTIVEDGSENIPNAIIKLLLYNLDPNEKKNLAIDKIKEKFNASFECIIDIKIKGEEPKPKIEKLPMFEEELSNRLKKLSQKSKVLEISKQVFGGISK
ncbi:MAG: nuclease SbcCD subunit D [Candidatus Nitrosocaldaceae archaeon]|nr:MAG: nuclease SbcCD subunit D [Candidatus Nitrosocaldaceae archaeon]